MSKNDDWDLPGDISPYLKKNMSFSEQETLEIHANPASFSEIVKSKAIDSKTGLDWNKVANDAAGMYLTGKFTKKEIAEVFGVSVNKLDRHVDLKAAKMKLLGKITEQEYQAALSGDSKSRKFILERQSGWNNKTEVEHSGQIDLRPVLNIGVKKLDKPDIEIEPNGD